MSTAPSSSAHPLLRGLTLLTAVAVIVAQIVGTGIFLKARVMTCNVGTPSLVLAVWVLAGLLSLAGALTYAELGTLMPRSGGEYNYLRAAYGRRWAFLFGWMDTFVGKTGSQAAMALAAVIFLNDLLAGALSPLALRLLPVGVIAAATLLNLASVTSSGRFATAMTVAKVALVAGVGLGAFLLADGSAGHYAMSGASSACEDVPASARGGLVGFGAAMLGALWAYDGWNALTHLGGEVRDPQRTIPRAFVTGVVVIIALYVFVNAAYFWALSPDAVAAVPGTSSVAVEVGRRFLGPAAAGVMAAGLVVSSFGSVHISILAGSRLTYALGRDGLLPSVLGRVAGRTRVPAASVLFHGVWSALLALTGSFDALTNFAVFGLWMFYAMATGAVFILRRRWPDAERPYRTWGYPVVPALFLVLTVFLLVTTAIAMPVETLAGVGLILLGLPVYAYYARRLDEPDRRREQPVEV